MSGYDHDADRESSAASSLVFTSDEEGDERAGVDSGAAQLYEGPSQAGRRGRSGSNSSASASSISAMSSASASASRGSTRSSPGEEQTRTRRRRSDNSSASSSASSSSSSSGSSTRQTRRAKRFRAAEAPAFPNLAPSLSALLPQSLFSSASSSSSLSTAAIVLPPGRAAQALHYFEAALRSGQKRSRDQAESVLRRQKRRASQVAAAAAAAAGGKGRGKKGIGRKRGLDEVEDATGQVEISEEADPQDQTAGGEAQRPRVEVSWIEEEAKLWIKALDADRPRQRSNSQSGSAPRLYSALSSSQRQSQAGSIGSQQRQQQQQKAPSTAPRSAGVALIGRGSQVKGSREVAGQTQPSSVSQGRSFAGFGPRGR